MDNDRNMPACDVTTTSRSYYRIRPIAGTVVIDPTIAENVTDEVAALRAELAEVKAQYAEGLDKRDTLRAERDRYKQERNNSDARCAKAEAERDAMRPVVEAAGHLLTVVEWLDDDSDRTEDWKQAYWDLRVAMEAHDGE